MRPAAGQGTSLDGAPIALAGSHALEASDRAIPDLLYRLAHDSGRPRAADAEREVPLARLLPLWRGSGDRRRDGLERPRRVIVRVPCRDPARGGGRVVEPPLLAAFPGRSTDAAPAGATVRFGPPRRLQPIVERPGGWVRARAAICPIGRFRARQGVPPGACRRGRVLVAKVPAPEIGPLPDIGGRLEAGRRSPWAPIAAAGVAWWRKEENARLAAPHARRQPKPGRMARLQAGVERAGPGARGSRP